MPNGAMPERNWLAAGAGALDVVIGIGLLYFNATLTMGWEARSVAPLDLIAWISIGLIFAGVIIIGFALGPPSKPSSPK